MYRVQLQNFEGPLDLLLFFIRRDEIDMLDIPIASIADEYLEYVRRLERVDLDGVGDFIFMAALLMDLKVKMLLPRPEAEEEEEVVDPRQDLVDRLLEYMLHKEAAEELATRQDVRARLFTRGAAYERSEEEGSVETYVNTTVGDLVMALGRLLAAEPEEPVLSVETLRVTVAEQRTFILEALERQSRMAFADLVCARSKPFVITTFLAALEMAQNGEVWLSLMPEGDDFWVQQIRESLDPGRMSLN